MRTAKEEIDTLTKDLLLMRYCYYRYSAPVVSDHFYDMMEKLLRRLEKEHPEFIWENSPSRTVGSDIYDSELEAELREFKLRWKDGMKYDDMGKDQ